MRYTVQAGDSPAKIAQQLGGDARRLGELLAANLHKPRAFGLGGVETFAALHVGEQLAVPDAWGVGRPRQYGLAQYNGFTISAAGAAAAAPAFAALTNVSDFSQPAACAPVKAAQQAWNANGGTPTLTVDGGYGPDTINAWGEISTILNGTPGQVPSPPSSYPNCGGGGGGGGGNFNSGVVNAAQALDAQLAAQGCCGCGQAGSALSNAVAAFKQAILVNPSDWGSNSSAPTVTGSTINVSDPACQIAFGSELGGTLADLKSVLGSSMQYSGSYCATSNCQCVNTGTNCGNTPPPPPACVAPQVNDSVTGQCVNPCAGGSAPANGVCPPAPSPSGGGSSNTGALVGILLLVGGGTAATYYAIKARRRHAA